MLNMSLIVMLLYELLFDWDLNLMYNLKLNNFEMLLILILDEIVEQVLDQQIYSSDSKKQKEFLSKNKRRYERNLYSNSNGM